MNSTGCQLPSSFNCSAVYANSYCCGSGCCLYPSATRLASPLSTARTPSKAEARRLPQVAHPQHTTIFIVAVIVGAVAISLLVIYITCRDRSGVRRAERHYAPLADESANVPLHQQSTSAQQQRSARHTPVERKRHREGSQDNVPF
ncbi:hypothetical protein ADEAN_000101100 [Angomonas deanei]|uniref:Transmembrane protein n=1 Tax=Angomonas deanei TaxID=59799 RepID=A0A7G2C1C8_9TRYP|nr:hypothetical protein ADEAN_000101100 [Angomonas deanei]